MKLKCLLFGHSWAAYFTEHRYPVSRREIVWIVDYDCETRCSVCGQKHF